MDKILPNASMLIHQNIYNDFLVRKIIYENECLKTSLNDVSSLKDKLELDLIDKNKLFQEIENNKTKLKICQVNKQEFSFKSKDKSIINNLKYKLSDNCSTNKTNNNTKSNISSNNLLENDNKQHLESKINDNLINYNNTNINTTDAKVIQSSNKEECISSINKLKVQNAVLELKINKYSQILDDERKIARLKELDFLEECKYIREKYEKETEINNSLKQQIIQLQSDLESIKCSNCMFSKNNNLKNNIISRKLDYKLKYKVILVDQFELLNNRYNIDNNESTYSVFKQHYITQNTINFSISCNSNINYLINDKRISYISCSLDNISNLNECSDSYINQQENDLKCVEELINIQNIPCENTETIIGLCSSALNLNVSETIDFIFTKKNDYCFENLYLEDKNKFTDIVSENLCYFLKM